RSGDRCSYRRPAHGQLVDADRREPHTHRDRLALLATGANALVELEVATDARDARQRIGTVADQRRALDRRGHAPVLDQVGLARREDELPARDVHLPAAEGHRIEPALDRFDDLLRLVIVPAGAFTAPSLRTAWRAASSANRRQRPSSRKKSNATRPPPP